MVVIGSDCGFRSDLSFRASYLCNRIEPALNSWGSQYFWYISFLGLFPFASRAESPVIFIEVCTRQDLPHPVTIIMNLHNEGRDPMLMEWNGMGRRTYTIGRCADCTLKQTRAGAGGTRTWSSSWTRTIQWCLFLYTQYFQFEHLRMVPFVCISTIDCMKRPLASLHPSHVRPDARYFDFLTVTKQLVGDYPTGHKINDKQVLSKEPE